MSYLYHSSEFYLDYCDDYIIMVGLYVYEYYNVRVLIINN